MVGKNIIATSINSMVSGFKGNDISKKSAATGDFSKTMSEVQDNQMKASNKVENKKKDSEVTGGMKKLNNSNKPKVDDGERLEVKPEVKEAMKTADSMKDTEVFECENAVVLASGQILTPKLLEQALGELEQELAELVTEVMDITEEELMDMLEESGMQLLDLLNPEDMKQFVLNANQCEDVVALLTNEEAATQLSELLEGLGNLTLGEELGITKEEAMSMLEEQAEEEVSQGTVEIVVEKESDSQLENSASKGESFLGSRESDKQDSLQESPMDVFIQNLAAKNVDGVNQASVEQIQVMKEIVNQVVEKIKIAIKPESTSMELQLNPESLGRVDLTVASKNGVLTASFTAENQIAKEAIESQIQVLKDNLNNQGVKVEAIEVNVSQFGFRQNTESGSDAQSQSKQQKKSGVRRINLDNFSEEAEDVSDEEVLAAKVLRDNGGTVDYTA